MTPRPLVQRLLNVATLQRPATIRRCAFSLQSHVRTGDIYFEKELIDTNSDRLPVVQWYPGHIAKSERRLKEELKILDVVLEVRDARCFHATTHPGIAEWLKNRKNKRRFLLLNRVDMISKKDRRAWERYLKYEGIEYFWTVGNGSQSKSGIVDVKRALFDESFRLNKALGIRLRLPRPPRVCVIGFPNVGKSSIVNRLLNRRACRTAPRAGITRELSWVLLGTGERGLNVLDSPGIIPTSMADQTAARKIAMCNNIGEATYSDSLIAAQLFHVIKTLPDSVEIMQRVRDRYSMDPWECTAEVFVERLGEKLFGGNNEQAGCRILKDYRELKLGPFALELPAYADYA